MSHLDQSSPEYDLLIIGGGYAACSALAWLARSSIGRTRVAVLAGNKKKSNGGGRALGCGLAYDNQDPAHLLNAAHWNMGLLDDDPDGFTRWLALECRSAALPDYASRVAYGRYLAAQWNISLSELMAKGSQVNVIEQDAVEIAAITDQWVTVVDDSGATCRSAALLVCAGPIISVQAGLAHPKLVAPMGPGSFQRLVGAAGHVAVIGTGLSGIDASITALAQPDVTKVTMVSRDGRLPLSHNVSARQIPKIKFESEPLDVLRAVRAASTYAPWQAVMNALRKQSNALWQAWTPFQRRSALRHLGGTWAAHRNRLPVDVFNQIAEARASSRLEVIKSSVTLYSDSECRLIIQPEGGGASIKPDWVVDARGFVRTTEATNTLIGRALRDGHFSMFDLGFGVAANSTHRATSQRLAPVHVVGAARLGDLIETTGAPEVRAQVRQSLQALFP